MDNMSYCQFQNTSVDLEVCLDALLELRDGGDDVKPLSDSERRHATRLVELCLEIAEVVAEAAGSEIDALNPSIIETAIDNLNQADR